MKDIKKNTNLIEVNNSIWNKIKNWFKQLWNKPKRAEEVNKTENIFSGEKNVSSKEEYVKNENDIPDNEKMSNNKELSNDIILKARKAFESYCLNRQIDLSENLYDLIKERIDANQFEIEELIKVYHSKISYHEIIEMLENAKIDLQNYKKTYVMKKIDENFLFSQYQVPVGVIGIATDDEKVAIENIFKSITTRNAIVVMEENYNKYSIENLILLIVKECLKKFNVDEDIIQIVKKDSIILTEIEEIDALISKGDKIAKKEYENKMYLYQEDDYFEEIVQNEAKRLKLSGKNVEIVKENFEECVNKINKKINFGACIYTKSREKGYKFVNLINSENVFFNGTLLNAKETESLNNYYFILKNLVCEY